MANKVIIGILVLLVIIAGGNGYYSYMLNQQIDDLGSQLAAFKIEQEDRINAVSDEIRGEMAAGLDSLGGRLDEARADITALDSELGAVDDRISGLEGEVAGVSNELEDLDERLGEAESKISRAAFDIGAIYERVIPAVVRIADGQSVAGSGFVYDDESHIVTAYHVVDSLSTIYVMMHDGRIFKATIVGQCEVSDVAVLKLESDPSIEPLPTGDSGLIRVGDPVAAIGSPGDSDEPLGLRDTLTTGIISQVDRFIMVDSRAVANMLQFDAAVNFGNSGGPLFNSTGEVIGLVTARIDPVRGDGIYWAVSSNKMKRVADAIIASGSFAYPWIGVGIADLTPQEVEDIPLETTDGVRVTAIFPDSPADAAGIQSGDIIVGLDGMPVRDMDFLTSYLGEFMSPGDEVVLDIIRGVTPVQIAVEVGTRGE
jgi:S1-C subfamily serine protease